MFPLAQRVSQVADSITLAVSAKANALKKAGVDVVGFGAGSRPAHTFAYDTDFGCGACCCPSTYDQPSTEPAFGA